MSYYKSSSLSNTRSSGALPSSKKTHSEQHKQILKQLLRETPNKTCVDCKTATHPRWASWNLGSFMCIRCSGIHRSMGTHISKVKSVDLDAWTDEQIESMVKWGNERCNIYWESKLPQDYIPDPLKIENFIRTKYDLKKWVSSNSIPDPLTIKASSPSNVQSNTPNQSNLTSPSLNNATKINSPPNSSIDILSSSKSSQPVKHSNNLLDDDFGSFSSITSSNSSKQQLPRLPTQQIQSPQSTGSSFNNNNVNNNNNNNNNNAKNGRNDLKKSILSLYSSPSSSSSSFIQPLNQSQSVPQIQQPHNISQQRSNNTGSSVGSLTNSLNGLNFNTNNNINNNTTIGSNSTLPQPRQKQTPISKTSSNTWNNEWNDNNSSSSINNTTNNNNEWLNTKTTSTPPNTQSINTNLDDDLFKNVWS